MPIAPVCRSLSASVHPGGDSLDTHLTIAFAVTRFIEYCASWLVMKFVCTARRYRTTQIRADAGCPARK